MPAPRCADALWVVNKLIRVHQFAIFSIQILKVTLRFHFQIKKIITKFRKYRALKKERKKKSVLRSSALLGSGLEVENWTGEKNRGTSILFSFLYLTWLRFFLFCSFFSLVTLARDIPYPLNLGIIMDVSFICCWFNSWVSVFYSLLHHPPPINIQQNTNSTNLKCQPSATPYPIFSLLKERSLIRKGSRSTALRFDTSLRLW